MARGTAMLAPTADEACARFLKAAPGKKVVACAPLDISDIPLRVPFDEPHWAIAFEDPEPEKFVQDVDPIAKVTRLVREELKTMVERPESVLTGEIEVDVRCPGCDEIVHLEIPPERVVRRPGFGPFLYSRCPRCEAELVKPKAAPRDQWTIRPPRRRVAPVNPPRSPGAGVGERRACVFCGAEDRKISKEHLWSKWMRAYVDGSDGGPTPKTRVLANKGGRVKASQTWPEAPFGQEISGPCKICNQGWMERVEDDARPFLIPMLENCVVELRPEAQRSVARWATLKLLIAHLGHAADKQTIPTSRYRQFFIDRLLPLGARIWIGRYDGSGAWPTAYNYLELFVTQNGGVEPPSPNGYLAGFSIGYLAFFYWGHEQRYGPIPDVTAVADYLVPIWPATGKVSWPPKGLLDGDGIPYVMSRFPTDRWN